MKELIFLEHAKQRIEERKISFELIKQAIENPDQIINENSSKIFHKIYIDKKKDKSYLLRVFITEDPKRIIISSVYRTSTIKKYWREEL